MKQRPPIPPFEFENWAAIAPDGIPNQVPVGDIGIDGRTFAFMYSSIGLLKSMAGVQ